MLVSYYSSHEGSTNIYLAVVPLKKYRPRPTPPRSRVARQGSSKGVGWAPGAFATHSRKEFRLPYRPAELVARHPDPTPAARPPHQAAGRRAPMRFPRRFR